MQIAVNGLVTGMTIAVIALAFVSVYLPTRIFHIALGAVYAVAPYIAWTLARTGWSWLPATTLAALTGVGVSLACEWVSHRPLARQGASPGVHLVSSLGMYVALSEVVALVWGSETRVLRTGIDPQIAVGPVHLAPSQVYAAVISTATVTVFLGWLHFSKVGLEFRAMSDNPVEFGLRGYNVQRLRSTAFGVSGALASLASLVTAYDLGFDYSGGLPAVVLALVAVIVGGRRSFGGVVVGGVLLGIVRSEVVWYVGARWQDAATFGILVAVLLLRPSGIVASRLRLEAKP